MFKRVVSRSFLGLLAAAMLGVFVATPVQAYGQENWQLGFAGTGVFPSGFGPFPSGTGFGFWGWCTFGGGTTVNALGQATSGTTGDCQLAQYFHVPSVSALTLTCHESIDVSSWDGTLGTFVVSGTASVTPTSLTMPCVKAFPGSASFTSVDFMFPAAPGHYNFGSIGGAVGEFQLQVTAIP